jgi:Spy/CpxP family protein refolding chaperone
METIDYTTSNTARAAADAAARRQQMLAMGILAVLLLGGMAFGWWRWQSTRAPDEPLVDIQDGRGWMNMQRPMPPPPPADGVRKVGNSYRLKSGDAVMYASQAKGAWQFSFSYQPNRLMSSSDSATLFARYNSQALELTKEQIDQIEKLGAFSSGMAVSEADRAKMSALWEAYLKASPPAQAEENALKTELSNVAARSVEPTRAVIQDRVTKIRQILTPEQIDKLSRPPGRARNAAPASQPAP